MDYIYAKLNYEVKSLDYTIAENEIIASENLHEYHLLKDGVAVGDTIVIPKIDKLVAGDNITIDLTNVIRWQVVEWWLGMNDGGNNFVGFEPQGIIEGGNFNELYNKTTQRFKKRFTSIK